jgi:transposase InsO family protein
MRPDISAARWSPACHHPSVADRVDVARCSSSTTLAACVAWLRSVMTEVWLAALSSMSEPAEKRFASSRFISSITGRACSKPGSATGALRTTREELRLAIITWIERTYHHRRRQRAFGKLTPVEYEAIIGETHLEQAA